MPLDRSLRQYRLGFVIVDALGVLAAFLLGHALRHGNLLELPPPYVVALPYAVATFLLAFRYFGAYETRIGRGRETVSIVLGVVMGMAFLTALGFFYRGFSYSRLTAIYLGVFSFLFVLIGRHAYRFLLDLLFGRSQWMKRVLVVGDGPNTDRVLEELLHHKSDYLPVGIVSATDDDVGSTRTPHRIPVVGKAEDIVDILKSTRPDLVVITDPYLPDDLQRQVIEAALSAEIHWMQVPRVTAPPDQDLQLTVLAGVPFLGSKSNNITGFNYFFKRTFDILVSASLLLLLSPLMAVVALLIKVISPGPVLFVQERIGYRGRPFRFYKFRSMHVNNDESIHKDYVKKWINGDRDAVLEDDGTKVHKLTDDPRIIPYVGTFIRKFSIDELPQLINVLKGDMSLVGPRPCLPYEVEMYKRWHRMRFDVLPGITGLWQVSGRNRLTFDEMVALDIRYLQNWRFSLDLAIMAKTPYVILFDKAY